MGQYYLIVNRTKKEFLKPHAFGDGAKLGEFACSANGAMTALALLLADGNGRGGGDLHGCEMAGRWAGDKIVITGDYADGNFIPSKEKAKYENLYVYAQVNYTDISQQVLADLVHDTYVRQSLYVSGIVNENGVLAKDYDERSANRKKYVEAHPNG